LLEHASGKRSHTKVLNAEKVLGVVTGPVIAWLSLGLIWGGTWLFIKIGLEDIPPFTLAAIRFFLAVVPLLFLVRVRRTPLARSRNDWVLTAVTGFLGFTLGYGLVFWGEQHIPAGLTAILFTTYPLFGMVFAHFLVSGEPITLQRLAGVVLGIAGVALIFGEQLVLGSSAAVLGSLAVVASAACAALSSVLIKARGGHLDPAALTVAQMLVGAVPLLVAGILLEGSPLSLHWTPKAVLSLGYLAFVGSSLAFVLWYSLIRAIKVTTAQLLPFMNTLVAVILGAVVLDEQLGWRALAGGAAILLGLAVALVPNGRRRHVT
jgi:drug/metabolite transporter (DMT)-like permease